MHLVTLWCATTRIRRIGIASHRHRIQWQTTLREPVGETPAEFEFNQKHYTLCRKRAVMQFRPQTTAWNARFRSISYWLQIRLTMPALCKEAMFLEDSLVKNGYFRLYTWDGIMSTGQEERLCPIVCGTPLFCLTPSHPNSWRTWAIFSVEKSAIGTKNMASSTGVVICFMVLLELGKRRWLPQSRRVSIKRTPNQSVVHRLSDDMLQNAISRVKSDSIVMEDIDCLFGTMREKKETQRHIFWTSQRNISCQTGTAPYSFSL